MNDILTAQVSSLQPINFDRPDRFLSIGDDEIAYWRTGTGPDVVLVHGWPLHAATWRDIVPALARHFTCHLIDLPGAGHTRSKTNKPLSLRAHARTLLAVLDEVDIERCAFVAHDSGAAITRLAADELGDRVWAMVMGNTEIPGHRPWLLVAIAVAAKLGGENTFTAMMRSRRIRHSVFGFGSCFENKDLIDGTFSDHFIAPLRASKSALRGQLRLLAGFDWADVESLGEVHQTMTAPVQLIWGDDDPYFPLKKARQMRFAGGSELHVIDNTRLFAHEEAADQFSAHAERFLRQHGPRR